MPESEKEDGKEDGSGNEGVEGAGSAGSGPRKPEADALQKLMKERFGDAKFGSLMSSIVDEMFKNMAEVKPSPNGPYAPDDAGEAGPGKADPGR